ncbi:MAG: DUF4375 domain-containing protein [Planctomycetales bacterium]
MDSRDATWEMKSELQDKIIAINDRIWGDWHTTSDEEAYAPFSHPEKVFSMIFYLDMEVENGGFYQWIMNSTGMYVRETRDALLEIGAPRVAALVSRETLRGSPVRLASAFHVKRGRAPASVSRETKEQRGTGSSFESVAAADAFRPLILARDSEAT